MVSVKCGGGDLWRKVRSKIPPRQLLKIYFIVFINLFSNSFAITMVFPFLPFMMEFLVPQLQEDKEAVGNYVGIVASSLFAGRIFGSYIWGVVADRKGRKPVIVISGVFSALTTLAFGFSVNLPMLIVTRFMFGLLNGTVPVAKAVASEVSDDSNQAFSISIVGIGWGTGYLLGPAVSGAIADPIGQYNLNVTNSFLHGYLTRFPYSLPCIVNALLFIIAITLAVFFLPETLGKKKNRRRSEITAASQLNNIQSKRLSDSSSQNNDLSPAQSDTDISNVIKPVEGGSPGSAEGAGNVYISNPATVACGAGAGSSSVEETNDANSMVHSDGEALLLESHGGAGEEEGRSEEEEDAEVDSEGGHVTNQHRWWRSLGASLKSTLLDLRIFFCDSATLISLLLYCVYSFGAIGNNEIFSVWAYTQPHLGGLGYSLHAIGICLTIVGVFMFPVILAAFPILERRFRTINTYYIIATVLIFTIPILPNLHYLVNNVWLTRVLLIVINFIINAATTIGFSAIFLLINNSVTFDKLGSINGVSTTMTSITRVLAPIVSGSLFSVSVSEGARSFGFPVDYHLVFVMHSVVYLITVFMVALLPTSTNFQKVIEDEDEL